jgi:CIC family chloride channel protein
MFTKVKLDYYEKWAVLGILLGFVAGATSLLIFYLLRFVEYIFLYNLVGTKLPVPLGFGGSVNYTYSSLRPYLLPLTAALGAFISGILTTFSPDAAGNGTDKVIQSFHYKQGKFDKFGWLIKAIASAFTIGSGGSAGREGPEAFVSASVASHVFDLFKLSPEDRRKAVAVALGSGIGTIFKSPIAGTLLSAELLYKRDFEYEVIYPSLIASAVGYMIFGIAVGYGPMFGTIMYSFSVSQIPSFLALGIVSGLFAILYVKSMFYFENIFGKVKLPFAVRAAIGGASVGVIGMAFPEIIAVGYGWMNLILDEKLNVLVGLGLSPIIILIMLPFLKILATSLTIGSGGSGGEFAPGIMIGGLVGSVFAVLISVLTKTSYPLAPYAIVGMASLFGAAANAPLAVIVMAVEMGGNLQLLPPTMLSAGLAFIIAYRYSLYHAQVQTRKDSPAHAQEYSVPLLKRIKVEDVMIKNIFVMDSSNSKEAIDKMKREGLASLPVIDEKGNFIGVVRLEDLDQSSNLKEKIIRGTPYVRPESTLEEAWEAMATSKSTWIPVVRGGKFIGIITMEDMLSGYKKIAKMQ